MVVAAKIGDHLRVLLEQVCQSLPIPKIVIVFRVEIG